MKCSRPASVSAALSPEDLGALSDAELLARIDVEIEKLRAAARAVQHVIDAAAGRRPDDIRDVQLACRVLLA
jgi:hypothetical protein